MKRVIKKVISIGLAVVLIGGLVGCQAQTKETSAVVSEELTEEPEELILWYTNEELTNYIEEASKEYGANNNIVVTPKLVSAIDYIEKINQAVLSNEAAPDLFISENSDLEKLYLAGLTLENQDKTYSESNYYKTALNAFTYKDKLLAYPLYFETSYLLYNQEYVTTAPTTIDEILNFADVFDAPEGVENIFNWDVTDILCNYFFIGNYLNNDEIDNENYVVDKDKLIESLNYYQNLNQYFAIDADTVDYETAFQKFMEGKSVFTIAKTVKLPEIEMIEGDVSEEEQEIVQDGTADSASNTNEEVLSETKENSTATKEQAEGSNQDNEESSQNNEENMEGTSEQSNQTQKISSSTTANYNAGVERILSQNSNINENTQIDETDSANSDITQETGEPKTNEELKESITEESDETKTNDVESKTTETIDSNPGTIIDKNSNFKIVPLPNLTNELEGKGIAVSFGVFINGYTSKQQEASKFAKYLTYNKSAILYKETGKLSARNGINYNNENILNVLKEYEKDVVSPKVMENGDFWLQQEIAFSNIWKGADTTQTVEEMFK